MMDMPDHVAIDVKDTKKEFTKCMHLTRMKDYTCMVTGDSKVPYESFYILHIS